MFPFEVDTETDVPLWVQLRQRLIYLINSGYFKPGEQLPTVRGLASDISINYNTVNKAYLSLVSDGYLESTRGRGVFVRDLKDGLGEEYSQEVEGVASDCISALRELGLSLDDIQRCIALKIKQLKTKEALAGPCASEEGSSRSGRVVTVDTAGAEGYTSSGRKAGA